MSALTASDGTRRERAVRIRLDGTSTRAGRGRPTWEVTAGRWSAEGATEKAATDALAGRLADFLLLYREPMVLSFRGYTTVLSLDLGDDHNPVTWTERVVDPRGRILYSGMAASGGWEAAEARVRYDLVHRSTDWHDDDSVHASAAYIESGPSPSHDGFGVRELYRYAGWQRAARAAKDSGREDWHEWASQHEAEFTVRPATEPGSAP